MIKIILLVTLVAIAATYQTQGNVLKLTADDFDAAVKEFPHMMVKYFAPWCGHCKKLAPVYSELADQFAATGYAVKMAEIDCTVHKPVCSKAMVMGYPTIYFMKEGKAEKYTGQRTKEGFTAWLEARVPGAAKVAEPAEAEPAAEEGAVVVVEEKKDGYQKDESVYVLTDDTYEKALEEFDFALVKFFAPWCGHCKKLAPAYKAAAKTLADKQSKAIIAEVDCTVNKKVCSGNGIRGYPTLKMFVKGNSEPIQYSASRTEEAIVAWVEENVANHIPIEGSKSSEEDPKIEEL